MIQANRTARRQGLGSSPLLPLAVAAAVAPTAAVLQSKAMAPLALITLTLAVLAHWRRHRALAIPRGGLMLWAALGLSGWAALSALWAPEPGRALWGGLGLGGMVLLAAGAAWAAMDEDDAAARRLLARCVLWGLVVGLALAALDAASGHAVRAAVRGLREAPPALVFGLKPAASVTAMLLPLVVAVPGLSAVRRVVVLAAGAAVLLLLPGDSAKIATLAGLGAAGVAALRPRLVPRAAGAVLAALLLVAPVAIDAGLAFSATIAERLPPSAAHRFLIWDFVVERTAERPLAGWGMEASRAIPGGHEPPTAAALERFGLTSPEARAWFGRQGVESLPLHPHNGALQIWLELGLIGALLAATLAWGLGLAAGAAPHAPAATGALVGAAITGLLSFGIWQAWWVASQLLLMALLAGLPSRPQRRIGLPVE